ncbi:nucleotidyl transferase AbiEii/AbiGii toxin family protein [Nocardioides sp. NPDC057764]|uniref:nucleotidyl transferase AbiEii/AbiGii toxin family protein n=1 Tax=Nocardioides sp. NPDC057764 TaxID=3346243 RepID=UPI0036721FFB
MSHDSGESFQDPSSPTAGYGDWRSLELAIKEAAKKASRTAGPGVAAATVDAQIRQARFDRFLTRVFADGERSEWLLKGGVSMLARVPQSRTTKDVDLAAAGVADLKEAETALARAVDVDLGDHITFELSHSAPTGLGENQPGVATRRYFFNCVAVDSGRTIDTVQVDVVVGPAPVGTPQTVEPANRLHLKKPLITHPYRLYPVADQVADKVCATMDTNYPGGRASSRVKDLVDLVVLARTQRIDLDELRSALATKRRLSQIEPFDRFEIPPDWVSAFPKLAAGVPGARDVSPAEAQAYVAQLVDPALSPADDVAAVWVPGAGWTAPDEVESVSAEVADDVAAGGDVYVRHHTRAGWPVREHWRAARGSASAPASPRET